MIFIYEYCITIGEEAKYFWKQNFTGASALFFLNRYVLLTLYILGFVNNAFTSDEVCYFNTNDPVSCTTLILLVRGLRPCNRYGVGMHR